MKKEGGGGGEVLGILIFSLFIIILIATITSASWIDWLRNPTITGKTADNLPTNVSVDIVGTSPVELTVWNDSDSMKDVAVNPAEGNHKVIIFNVTVYDPDGATDINDSSVRVWVNRTTATLETIRANATACAPNTGETTDTRKNYTCSFNMSWYDRNGTWTINVTANDKGIKTFIHSTDKRFDYGELKAINIGPVLLAFPAAAPADADVLSSHNTTLNNTGNVVIIDENIKVSAIDLQGMTVNTKYLNASNFTASFNYTNPGTEGQCDNSSAGSGIRLENATEVGITGLNLTAGDYTADDGYTGQEIIYYCIPKVPTIPSQTYATNNSGAWVIKVV